jgi:beta-lactamase regulating signal transducer with metallopeptidase domain
MMQQVLASYLVNAAWQVPLVAICALAISRFAGLSPRAHNHLWLAFLGTAAILPALSLTAVLPRATPTVALVPVDAPLDVSALPAAHAAPSLEPAISLAPWSAWVMIALFAAVAAALTARLIIASAAARRLVSQSRAVALPADVMQAVEGLARAHGRTVPPIRQSSRISGPAVVGALRPVILIPHGMATHGEDLRAALLHEMAHVLRHDYAVNVACEVLTLPICWHPALLGIKAGVSRSRELACDAIAAAAMASPKTYAKCLVSLARTLGAPSSTRAVAPVTAALAVGLFGRSDLEDRLMQLMKPKDADGPVLRVARLCGLAAVGASLLGSAALLHVTPVFAQAAPAAASSPTATAVTAPAPSATVAADQAQRDAGKPPVARQRSGLTFSRKGVIIEAGQSRYPHRFTASDGQPMTVYTRDPNDPSPEQRRAWEAALRDAEAKAQAAERMVSSPEFKARIAKAEAQAAAAEAMERSPEFKARMARAEAQAAAAEAMERSPEFRARMARAEAQAAAAEKMANSAEFKARIARAQAAGAAMEATAARLQQRWDEYNAATPRSAP